MSDTPTPPADLPEANALARRAGAHDGAILRTYQRVLDWPRTLLVLCLLVSLGALVFADRFRFDASSEDLVVDGDPDLAAYERIAARFGGDDFLLLTYAPADGEAFGEAGLAALERLTEALAAVPGVKGVFSVLDAPLLESPPLPLAELANGLPTLRSDTVDRAAAKRELTKSPFFRELLVTKDGSATAIKIDLTADDHLRQVTATREMLKARGELTGPAWDQAHRAWRTARDGFLADRARLIAAVRAVQDTFGQEGRVHLGGVPMITADMIDYVKRDIVTFSGSVVGLMILTLAIFFRRTRWVVLPIASAGLTVLWTVGLLGLLEWQATVISSNFVSLLAITAVSFTIHLIVQYRELLQRETAPRSQEALVRETMQHKFAPCVFTAITTIAAFGSLTASSILPVEQFGWMMCIGILIALVVTFTFFPAMLLVLPKGQPSSTLGRASHFIRSLGELAKWRPVLITVAACALAVAAYFGVMRVSLDNRFVEYFDADTEIYRGMRFIDRELGGTIPFDVVIELPAFEALTLSGDDDFGDGDDFAEDDFADDDFAEDDFADDDFADDFADGGNAEADFSERYWFTRNLLDRLEPLHRFLDAQPQVGKVMSLTALEDLATAFNDGEKLSSPAIAAVMAAIPAELRAELITPYASPSTGELRLSGRIVESGAGFDRRAFRERIEQFATEEMGLPKQAVTVSGMMVLFDGMLQQLLSSQIDTLAWVLLAVFVMFLALLRSLPHALLGMIPNTLAAATVIAAMGYGGIPLDMMTTTIAAICIGIGVDDTIHYLHRFREELARWGDARIAVTFAHASIGRAMYYTSLTVIAGFSVLYFSNFVPTVMFGFWTAVAMLLALLANLTLLPALLVVTHARRAPKPSPREP